MTKSTDTNKINDLEQFKHGQEGTHFACAEMTEKLGGKVGCCGCNKHKCKDTNKPIYAGWICPHGDFNVNNATEKDIDDHMNIHTNKEEMGWEERFKKEFIIEHITNITFVPDGKYLEIATPHYLRGWDGALALIDFIRSTLKQEKLKLLEEINIEVKKTMHSLFGDKKAVDGYVEMDSHSINKYGSKLYSKLEQKKKEIKG